MDTGVEDITISIITTATKDIPATASLRSKRKNIIQRIGGTNFLMMVGPVIEIMTDGMATEAEQTRSLREHIIAVTRTGTVGITTNGVN